MTALVRVMNSDRLHSHSSRPTWEGGRPYAPRITRRYPRREQFLLVTCPDRL